MKLLEMKKVTSEQSVPGRNLLLCSAAPIFGRAHEDLALH